VVEKMVEMVVVVVVTVVRLGCGDVFDGDVFDGDGDGGLHSNLLPTVIIHS
jgi:hypothetical protein